MSVGQVGALGGLQDSREGKEDKGLGPAPQACAIPAGLMVYFSFCIWRSQENQQELQQPAAVARSIVFPNGSLEETVQVMQALSQALAQELGFMEQPPVHEDSWRPAHPPPPSQEAGGPGSPLCLGQLMFADPLMLGGPQDLRAYPKF